MQSIVQENAWKFAEKTAEKQILRRAERGTMPAQEPNARSGTGGAVPQENVIHFPF